MEATPPGGYRRTSDSARLSLRGQNSHKGDYGKAVIVGGSRGMAGAVALAGRAALRGGAGLVNVATADVCLETVAAIEPSFTTTPLPCDDSGRMVEHACAPLLELSEWATCMALGPGLGRSPSLSRLVLRLYREVQIPMVCDADALNALAEHAIGLRDAGGPRILTPHAGELQRLTGAAADDADAQAAAAIELARKHEPLVVVLKGNRTLVTDGQQHARNTTGNAGMATGGSGDVLTGLIVALMCQGLTPWDAACRGVFLHGLAGDLAAGQMGQVSLISRDIIDYLPAAIQQEG